MEDTQIRLKTQEKSNTARFFLARLLVLLAGRPRFCLGGSVGWTIGLAIGGAVSIAREVPVDLSGCSLWNELMSFLRCWTTEAGSQVFSSFGYLFHESR